MKKKIKKIARTFIRDNKDPIIAYSALVAVILIILSPFAFGGASAALALGSDHVPCLITLGISFLGTALVCAGGIYLLYSQASYNLWMKARNRNMKKPEKKIKFLLIPLVCCEAIFLAFILECAIELCFKEAYSAAGVFFFAFSGFSILFFLLGITKEFE